MAYAVVTITSVQLTAPGRLRVLYTCQVDDGTIFNSNSVLATGKDAKTLLTAIQADAATHLPVGSTIVVLGGPQ